MNKSVSAIKLAAIIICIWLLSHVVGYFASLNSDAFNEASKFAGRAPEVTQELGENAEVSLSPFAYELEFAGNQGEAYFGCNVAGDKKKGYVQIYLWKSNGDWTVKKASLHVNNKIINIRIDKQ